MKAMLFSAGLGTRMKPFTETSPKPLVPVLGKPLLAHCIDYLCYYNIREICINIHYFPEQILDFVKEYQKKKDFEVFFSDETDELLETGGGLVKAKDYFCNEDYFFALNSDILADINLDKFLTQHKRNEDSLATLAISERKSGRNIYTDEQGFLTGWKNHTSGETIGKINETKPYAFSGLHIINSKIFNFLPSSGKFSIMTEYLKLMDSHTISTYLHSDEVVDVGRPESIPIAEDKLTNYHWYDSGS